MRQTIVCLNRVFKFYVNSYVKYIKFVSRGLTQALVLAKKVCNENRKKQTKIKNHGRFMQVVTKK